MRNIIFYSPHDLPYSHISRNFDFARRFSRRGHAVTVIANNFSHRDKVDIVPRGRKFFECSMVDGVNVVWLNTKEYDGNGIGRAINAIGYLVLALRYSAKFVEKADYCIGDSVPSTAGLVAWFVSMLKKSRFIYQVRDVWPIALVYDGALKKSSLTYFVLRILEVFLYRKSSKIVSTVPLLAPHLLSSRVSPEKLVYIPNGVDLDVIKFSPRDERFSGPINVTYAGGFGNAHDPLSIIHAAKILGEAGRSLRFDFYGEGIKLRSCIDLASALSLDNVFFHKSVSKADLSRVLSMSDILIAAVTDSDAYQFGLNLNKLYDYLAAGRPVVLAARSKHRVVEDAECGYMVPPESPEKLSEAILTICDLGPGRRIAMGANGRKFAETNYDINQLAVEFERAAFAN